MDEILRKKIEAILFSIGKKIHIDELLRMIKEKDKAKVVTCLIELKQKYNDSEENSLMILQDGDYWKLTIKDQYIDVAKEIGVETELSKTVMETLAVIAYKYPILQSDVIKIRTNKAYDHMKELEELGYIMRERYGRTKRIKLTQKFFEYFDLPPDKLREKFHNVEEMEKVISDKENQIHEINEKKKELIEQQDRESKALEGRNIYMENLGPTEVIRHDENGIDVIEGEKLGQLEVFEELNVPKNDINTEEEEREEKETPRLEVVDEDQVGIVRSEEDEDVEKKETSEDDGNDESIKSEEGASHDIDTENIDNDQGNENDIQDEGTPNEHAKPDISNIDENMSNLESIQKEHAANEHEEEISKIQDAKDNMNSGREINHDENVVKSKEEDKEEDVKIESRDYNIHRKKEELDEDKLFNMEGIPKEIMDKIEERAEEIVHGDEEKGFEEPLDKSSED
ncbi:SMC-Scp complex subunit ScpB [Candidatus Woesearchaeota archaeon]|nr:SMC-Scp complex subunit ScpB [Candidatus Woesearchaeota archaeon]